MRARMRRIGYLSIGLVFVTSSALAVDKRRNAGTLARLATPARLVRAAEIAKDASPPKVGSSKLRTDYGKVSTASVRIPIGR